MNSWKALSYGWIVAAMIFGLSAIFRMLLGDSDRAIDRVIVSGIFIIVSYLDCLVFGRGSKKNCRCEEVFD